MLHTYIQLPNATCLGYSARRDDKTVLAGAVRATDGGYDVALVSLPSHRWIAVEGFDDEELESIASLIKSNEALIMRLADEAAERDGDRNTTGPREAPSSAAFGTNDAVGQTGGAPRAAERVEFDGAPRDRATTAPGAPNGPGSRAARGASMPSGANDGNPAAKRRAGDMQGPDGGDGSSGDSVHDYQQAASAVLDAASLLGRVAPGTRLGRVVNLAMPAARSVVSAAPGIVEKAGPAVTQAAKAAPKVAEKAAQGLGRIGGKIVHAASEAVGDAADAAKRAAEEFKREQ